MSNKLTSATPRTDPIAATGDDWPAPDVVFEELLYDGDFELSERKRRLFLCACVRQAWLLLEEPSRQAVEVAERYVEGLASVKERDSAWCRCFDMSFLGVGSAADRAAALAVGDRSGLSSERMVAACAGIVDALLLDAGCKCACGLLSSEHCQDLPQRLRAVQQALFRDIVGPRLRPVRIEPTWLSRNDFLLPRLAGTLHDERRWSEMTVLGDALEDAGCTDDDLLEHCHGPGLHTRGCWVLDLILCRE
jgi:hypothetical protein